MVGLLVVRAGAGPVLRDSSPRCTINLFLHFLIKISEKDACPAYKLLYLLYLAGDGRPEGSAVV